MTKQQMIKLLQLGYRATLSGTLDTKHKPYGEWIYWWSKGDVVTSSNKGILKCYAGFYEMLTKEGAKFYPVQVPQ